MKKVLLTVILGVGLLSVGVAYAADQYHVYKLSNGECEIDTRDHDAMKNQRGTDNCLGHFSSRSSAQDLRSAKVKEGACKCPSGQNC